MKSEEEWMIQWTNVNQNLIDALVFFKWKWGFLYQIDLDSRGKLLALSLWTELTEIYEKKSNFTTGKELRNWLTYIGNQTKILFTHITLFQMRCESQIQSQLQFRRTTRNSVFFKQGNNEYLVFPNIKALILHI